MNDDSDLIKTAQQALRNWYGGIRMRAYIPVVEYVRDELIIARALYLASSEYVVTVVRSHHRHLGASWPEMPWILPAEIKLLAALALAVPEGRGMLSFAPALDDKRLNLKNVRRLDEAALLAHIRSVANEYCAQIISQHGPYSLREADSILADRRALLKAIKLSDSLLMRGLYCLLKSQHLYTNPMFGEEAFINVQIAREAALEIIREHLATTGMSNPTYAAAHDYIREHFLLGGYLADFLVDQHDRWVAVRHPKSKHGTFWTPPLMADDFFETYGALVSLYRHILLDEPGRVTADLG